MSDDSRRAGEILGALGAFVGSVELRRAQDQLADAATRLEAILLATMQGKKYFPPGALAEARAELEAAIAEANRVLASHTQ